MNRLVGNVIIVDSAMGNTSVLNSANNLLNIRKYSVNSVAFTRVGATIGGMSLSVADTTNVVVVVDSNNALVHFSQPQVFDDLKVPTLVGGTGFIYLA